MLHPPLLDEVGLPWALRWYVDGFSQRSKIAVNLDIASDLGRFGNEIEITIFRVVQECLTNVHRHSRSRSAAVRLVPEGGRIQLEIRDAGKGIPLEKQPALSSSAQLGVGFRGMRERITQLAGTFNVHSDGNGTVVIAILPLEASVMASSSFHDPTP